MPWYDFVACFFGGAFFVNAIPHFVQGVSGRKFPTPFASPPGRGLSSSTVNVLWGVFNAVIAWFLLLHVGHFGFRRLPELLAFAAGGLVMGIMLSKGFWHLHEKS